MIVAYLALLHTFYILLHWYRKKTHKKYALHNLLGESDYKTGHMVPPLYWRICILEILPFGDLEISFIYRDPWAAPS